MRDLEDCTEFDLAEYNSRSKVVPLRRFRLSSRFAADVRRQRSLQLLLVGAEFTLAQCRRDDHLEKRHLTEEEL